MFPGVILPLTESLYPKELLDVTHEQKTKRNLTTIKKESGIFGLLFLGDGAKISRCPLLNILDSGENIPMSVLEIVDLPRSFI